MGRMQADLVTQLASVHSRARLQLIQEESEVTLSPVVRRPMKKARLKRHERTAKPIGVYQRATAISELSGRPSSTEAREEEANRQ